MAWKAHLQALAGSSLFRSAGVYVATSLLNAALPFLLLPVLTRWLDRADYGRVAMFQVAVNVAVLFTGASVDGAVARMYFDRAQPAMGLFLGNCLWILVVSTVVVGGVVWGCSGVLSGWLELPGEALWCVLLVSAFRFLSTVALSLWQVRGEPGRYAAFQVGMSLFTLVTTLVLVMGFRVGWWGPVLSQVGAAVVFGLVGLGSVVRRCRPEWRLDWGDCREALRFGLPLIPHSLGGLAIGMTDRFAISNMVGLEAAGVYVVGVQIGMGVNLIQSSFNTAWTPWLFGRLKRDGPGDRLSVVRVTYLYFVVILGIAGGLSLLAPWIFKWFIGERFREAAQYVPWIALGFAINGMYKMVGGVLFYAKRTEWLAFITLAAGVLNVAATVMFVRWWGVIGAAYAVPVSFVFLFVMTWRASLRAYDLPWLLRGAGGGGAGRGDV